MTLNNGHENAKISILSYTLKYTHENFQQKNSSVNLTKLYKYNNTLSDFSD